jgi:hypothetical protein
MFASFSTAPTASSFIYGAPHPLTALNPKDNSMQISNLNRPYAHLYPSFFSSRAFPLDHFIVCSFFGFEIRITGILLTATMTILMKVQID